MTTFAIVVFYQYMENYGASDWNGTGECPQHWKPKGSHEEVIAEGLTVSETAALGGAGADKLIKESKLGYEHCNDYVMYLYMGYEIVELNQDVVNTVVSARETSYDPDDPIALSYVTHLTEYQCQWALNQINGEVHA